MVKYTMYNILVIHKVNLNFYIIGNVYEIDKIPSLGVRKELIVWLSIPCTILLFIVEVIHKVNLNFYNTGNVYESDKIPSFCVRKELVVQLSIPCTIFLFQNGKFEIGWQITSSQDL